MKKLLALTTTLSLGAGVFGVAGAAQAAVFSVGSTLNFSTTVQLNQLVSPTVWAGLTPNQGTYPAYTTITGPNDVWYGADNEIQGVVSGTIPASKATGDVLFAPTLPNGDTNTTASNQILNAQGAGGSTPGLTTNTQGSDVIDAQPGELGVYGTLGGNSGTWGSVAAFITGQIRNFDSVYQPNQLNTLNAFMYLDDNGATAGGNQYYFSLDDFSFSESASLPNAYDFIATGRVLDIATGEIANVSYVTTTQALTDLPLPGLTPPRSQSWTITITSTSVPEPTGVMGVIAATTLGLLTARKRKLNK